MTPPLLVLEQVRTAVAGATLLDNVTLRTISDRVGVSGKTAGVRTLLTGEASLVRGEALVLGRPLSEAREAKAFGCAVALSQVPKKWSVRRVLELAAEVAGRSPREATGRVRAVVDQIGEPSILKCRWSRAGLIEQTLASLALGLIADPPLLFVSLPFGALDPSECERYTAALTRATQDRQVLAEVDRIPQQPCEQEWIASLSSFTYVFEGRDAASSEARNYHQARYLLRVTGKADEVEAALHQAGTNPTPINAPSDWARGRCAFLVSVDHDSDGAPDTGPLLDVCIERDLPIIELLPV